MDRLYEFVWPGGRFEGDLARSTTGTPQKGDLPDAIVHLYVINTVDGKSKDWTSIGAMEPIISPDAKWLFYLRGKTLYREAINVGAQGVSPAKAENNASKIEGVELLHLYGCVRKEGGPLELWAEVSPGVMRRVLLEQSGPRLLDFAGTEFASLSFEELLKVQRLRSLRPDGAEVTVRNHKLIVRAAKAPSMLVVAGFPPYFFGNPVWASPESPYVFVNGLMENR